MKKTTFIAAIAALTLTACGGKENNTAADSSADTAQTAAANATATEGEAAESAFEVSDSGITVKAQHASMPVVIDFSATWCGPCRQLAPMFDAWEKQYAGKILFLKIDVDRYPGLADLYGISGIPHVVIYDGKPGAESARVLKPEDATMAITGLQPDALTDALAKLAQ